MKKKGGDTMPFYKVEVIDAYGYINKLITAIIIDGELLTEKEIIQKACEQNAEIAKIIENEPHRVVYAPNGKVLNAQAIEQAMYVIVVPL